MRTQTLISQAVYRHLAGTPSRTLADTIGVDHQVVYGWLQGQVDMTTDDIDALATGLEMSAWELIEAAANDRSRASARPHGTIVGS